MITYKRFKNIIDTIISCKNKRRRIGKFFEKELMEDSYCLVTFGNELENELINLLADIFDCWFEWPTGSRSNDIEWWLYEAPTPKKLTEDNQEFDVTSTKQFYDYLVKSKEKKHGK